ncbi:hypothetical protein KIV66_gp41 [Mycobacterium phage MyraDee]|uniref:Uncharacterized protein n=1 Tax=Mycobacterium phage MyraDee TaxID=2024303 RepID=A0A222YXZ8_9CAUD|nr:hypothetical protein KIV66_gp41 [Mycobacterium phage MyraDee]ASR77149.1 hypothetical protein SEA_MYRADEE_41 [Mycobacterium phage MyraDee]
MDVHETYQRFLNEPVGDLLKLGAAFYTATREHREGQGNSHVEFFLDRVRDLAYELD